MTFNTITNLLGAPIINVLNLVINGWPSILKKMTIEKWNGQLPKF